MTGKRSAVVTGAGSGIGACITTRLAESGWDVFAVARAPEQLDLLAAINNVRAMRADIRSDDDVNLLAGTVAEHTDYLHALVNCAGVLVAGTVGATPVRLWETAVETNFLGTLRVTQALLPLLAHPNGRIVTMSSIAASVTVSPQGPYAASKAALEIAMEALGQDLVASGARVTIVQPGVVATPIHASAPVGSDTLDTHTLRLGLRLGAFVRSQLRSDPTTPAYVADRVVEILASPSPPFRAIVGTDAIAMANGRKRSADTDWVDWWGRADDASWREDFQLRTGLAAP